jgi:sulfate adenylyltransferase subunit 1
MGISKSLPRTQVWGPKNKKSKMSDKIRKEIFETGLQDSKGMDLLRFITAGSVDDGKSTLIGRLLFDSKSILIDQLEALEKQSKNKQDGEIDLALLTDGLRAEREQGITIDVAYKYFSTPKRKFIIADAPGHIQYTRNMVTGASNANLIVILVDARNGVVEQTRRHSIIASLLNIPHVVVAINKMDLVDFSQDVFNNIVIDYAKTARALDLKDVRYLPISALKGDNIVERSDNLSWYEGETLLELLENISIEKDINLTHERFPVQYVIRPQSAGHPDYRGYAGKVLSGIYKKGDAVTILPSGQSSRIKAIEKGAEEVGQAFAGQSVVIHLEDDIDISRGDLIVSQENKPRTEQELEVLLCWMDTKPLVTGNKYLLQINSRRVRAVIREIEYKLDVNSLEKNYSQQEAGLNDIVRARIRTASPVCFDTYKDLQANGSAILIDETSNVTVGACMIQH